MSALYYRSHFNWNTEAGPFDSQFCQSNLFTLINVLGIKNYVLNKADEFESGSFDITTSLST